jgi:hypothetical protein
MLSEVVSVSRCPNRWVWPERLAGGSLSVRMARLRLEDGLDGSLVARTAYLSARSWLAGLLFGQLTSCWNCIPKARCIDVDRTSSGADACRTYTFVHGWSMHVHTRICKKPRSYVRDARRCMYVYAISPMSCFFLNAPMSWFWLAWCVAIDVHSVKIPLAGVDTCGGNQSSYKSEWIGVGLFCMCGCAGQPR